MTKAVNTSKNSTQVVQQKSKVKSAIHAAVQNMKKALQSTGEEKAAPVVEKKPTNAEEKKFTNREKVGRSLESMIKGLEGTIVDDKPASMLLGNNQLHSVFNITLSHS